MSAGLLFIFAGASGSGKSTICRNLAAQGLGEISISHTTRQRTANETNGVEYFFVSKTEFEDLIAQGQMAEWSIVHDEYYGTGKHWLDRQVAAGTNVLLDLDAHGTKLLREQFPALKSIFILPPSMEILEQRLHERKRDDAAQIRKRLNNAWKEIAQLNIFDYIIVNDDLARADAQALAIIQASCGQQDYAATAQECTRQNQQELISKWQNSMP